VFVIDVIGSVFRAIGRVTARIVELIRITVAPRGGAPTDCDDAGRVPGCGANPRVCGSSQAVVYGPTGPLAEYPTPCGTGPHTLVRGQAGFVGLDAAARAELRFAPASVVTIQVVHFSNPGRIEAFQGGSLVDAKSMASTAGVAQQFTLNGNGIDRIVVTPASPNDVTLVIGWCH
jgi:hypothetical protein